MRHIAWPLAGLLLLSSTGFAAKGPEKSAAAWRKDGERLYDARKYLEAAEALQRAQELEPHPKLVYNIARAYEQANELDLALKWYEAYTQSDERGTDPTLLKRSVLAIDRLRGLIRQRDEQRAAQEAERRRLGEETQKAQARAESEAQAKLRAEEETRVQRRAVVESERRNYERARMSAFVAGGGALLGLGVGTAFGVMANTSRARFNDAQTVSDKQEFERQTRQNAVIADIGMGVGVAAAVTAFLLYPKGAPPAEPQARLLVAPHGAGVEVRF